MADLLIDTTLEGRELDERVAKMMGCKVVPNPAFNAPDYHTPDGDVVTTFQAPIAFYRIVLPWMRSQGYGYSIARAPDAPNVSAWAWRDADAQAIHADDIIATLNALVRAHEATQSK